MGETWHELRDAVEATLTYTRSSGVEVDDTTFRLVREGGVLKIADSAVR